MDALIKPFINLIRYCIKLLSTKPITKNDKLRKIFAFLFLVIVFIIIIIISYNKVPELIQSKTKEEIIESCDMYCIRGDINLSSHYRNDKFCVKLGTEKITHEIIDDLITFYIPSKVFKSYDKLLLFYDKKIIKRIRIPNYKEFKIDNTKNICTANIDDYVINDTDVLNVIENFSDVLNKKLDSIKFSLVNEDLKPLKKTEPETLVKKEVVQKSTMITNGQIIAGSVLLNKKLKFYLPKDVNIFATYYCNAHETIANAKGGYENNRILGIESILKNIALKSGSRYTGMKILFHQVENQGHVKIEY